jgi:hypothetical protein
MSQNKGLRAFWKDLASRSRSNSRRPRDGTLDSGESACGTGELSDTATSTSTTIIDTTRSLASTRSTPSTSQPLQEVLPAAVSTSTKQSASTQSRFGLFQLTPPLSDDQLREEGFDIVAIHGITGDYERTWTHPQGALWLKDFLPNDLPARARVFSFGYDAKVEFSVSRAKLTDFSRSLLQALKRERRGNVCFILLVS